MCAKFGSSSTTRMQRVANGALSRSSSKRGMLRHQPAPTRRAPRAGLRAAATGAHRLDRRRRPASTYCCGSTRVNTLPCPGVLLTLMEPPSKRGQVAGNRQAQPGAAVTAIGGAIGLAEGFENAFLLILGNADPRVAHGKGNAVVRRRGTR